MTNLELINRLEQLEDSAEAFAWVVKCNDSAECVVVGSKKDAEDRVEVERERHYQSNKWGWVSSVYPKNWNTMGPVERERVDRVRHRERCYWRAYEVPLY